MAGRGEGTDKRTHTRINGLGVGRRRLFGWFGRGEEESGWEWWWWEVFGRRKGELIAHELHPGRSRIDVQLEELPVWKMCPFQLNGICFKENRS